MRGRRHLRPRPSASLLLCLGLIAGCAAPPVPAPAPTAPATTAPAATSGPASTAPPAATAPTPPAAPAASSATPGAASGSAIVSTPSPAAALPTEQRAAFETAHLLLVEGDLAAAATSWRALLQSQLPPSAASEARFELSLALARAGRGAEALDVLATPPPAPDDRDAFARGLALDAAGQHAQAMHALADAAAAHPPAAAAIWLEVAEHELQAGRAREAADATAHGLDTAAARALKQRLLDVRAQALASLGDNEGAFDAHRQVLALATSDATLGEQLFRLAQASRDLGKRDAAVQALKTALEQFPSASTTPDALRLLDELGAASEIDPYILGRARYFAVDYRNAVSAFDAYLQADPDGPDAPSARLYRALASLTPGNEPNALRDLDAIADDPNQDSELAAQALSEAGQALEGLNEPDQAEVRYQRLLDRFPRLDAAATAGFRLGLVRYQRGADADAIAAWDALIARRDDLSSDDVSRALYWRAKALRRLGREADAQASLQAAAAVRPAGYYALRAQDALGQLGSGTTDSVTITPADEQALGPWFAARGLDLAAADQTVAADPALGRAQAEAALGLFRQANWDADELLQRYPDRPDRLYALARRFAALDLAGGAAQLGQAAYTAAAIQAPSEAPAALRKLAYPRPFANLTDAAAARYGLDPLLLAATFRDASQFDAWAQDAASGASGLAQISPVHAEEVALGLHARASTAAATDQASLSASAAVDDQAWLLADRLRRTDGRPAAALAALATTDRLADSWLVRPGADDPDAFVELIDYESVRASLRSLLATRLAYAITYAPADATTSAGAAATSSTPASAAGQPPADPLAPRLPKPEPTAAWIKIARLAGDVPPDAPLQATDLDPAPPGSPAAALQPGTTLERDGNTPAAIAAYQAVLATAGPELAAAARLRLGQALLGAGRPAEALAPLQAADASSPSTVASFLLGRALADLGRCDDALPVFDRFATANPGALAAQAQVAGATCLQNVGRAADAVPLLEQAAQTPDLPRLQSLDLREKLALGRLRAGDTDGAAAEYASLLAAARTSSYRAELHYDLGVLASDPATAASHFRSTVQLDPKGRAARAALDELVALQDPAAQSLEAGDTRFEQNRYREALAAYAANPGTPQAAYGRGVSLVRLGQERTGIGVLEQMAQQFPNTPEAADGVFRAGRIRESLADLDGAAQNYRAVIAQPNAGTRANDARFRLAFVQFQQSHLDQATAGWRDLVGRASDAESRAQANFWLGKALHASGDEAGAQRAWSAAQSADPRGFYGLRAADLLAGRTDPRANADASLAALQQRTDDDPLTPLRSWAASVGNADAASIEQHLRSDPDLARADDLLAMGLRQPAIWELQAVEARVASNPAALAVLGGLEQRRGLYNTALVLGFDLVAAANVSSGGGPGAIRRLLYPLPHPLALATAAQQLHLDPLLFAALMRQESNMDQAAESAAQARGLSQLVASTAYDAARALGLYNFVAAELYQPSTSIRLGAFTFGQRLARYDQRIFPALAAYNAGTISVDGWLLSAGQADIDTFAEAIPFTETYPYVQHIYENYRQYLSLYGSQVQ